MYTSCIICFGLGILLGNVQDFIGLGEIQDFYFEEIRVFTAGKCFEYISME